VGEFERALVLPERVIAGDIAGWLGDAMAERRLSARVVGMRTGIDHSTITRLLQGERQPSLTTLVALLRLFKPQPLDNGHANGHQVTTERLVGRTDGSDGTQRPRLPVRAGTLVAR
jgi:transcriptional regulator with XRE-family HTH domain